MTLFECVQTYLLSLSGLAAKVPGGIVPQVIMQGSNTFPMIMVRLLGGPSDKPTHDGGPSPWSLVRIEFTCYTASGQDIKTAEQIMLQVAGSFQRTQFYLGGSNNGLYGPTCVVGPRSVEDPVTRLLGIQYDAIGYINTSTLS